MCHQSERDTGQNDQQIGHGQINEEDVGDAASQVLGPENGERHQGITNEADAKHQTVSDAKGGADVMIVAVPVFFSGRMAHIRHVQITADNEIIHWLPNELTQNSQ